MKSAISGLMLLANLVRAHDVNPLEIPESSAWKEEEGVRYCSLLGTSFIDRLLGRVQEMSVGVLGRFLDGVDVNLVEITGKLPPHHHEESDIVLRCVRCDQHTSFTLTDPVGFPVLYPARIDDLYVIHKGAVHGFERREGGGIPFWLLEFSYPPLKDDDVVYRA